jgi:hypothetical protein
MEIEMKESSTYEGHETEEEHAVSESKLPDRKPKPAISSGNKKSGHRNPEGARKNSQMTVVSITPDVCKTPMGNSTPPVPYQIVGNLGDSVSISPNVNFANCRAFLLDQSVIPTVTGDEPGTAGGVKSGTNESTCEPAEASPSVRVNGRRVVRHDDRFKMNNGNTFGKAVCEVGGGSPRGAKAE